LRRITEANNETRYHEAFEHLSDDKPAENERFYDAVEEEHSIGSMLLSQS